MNNGPIFSFGREKKTIQKAMTCQGREEEGGSCQEEEGRRGVSVEFLLWVSLVAGRIRVPFIRALGSQLQAAKISRKIPRLFRSWAIWKSEHVRNENVALVKE